MNRSTAKLYYLFCIYINKPCKTLLAHTAKTQYRKFDTYIPRKGIARLQSHDFNIHVSVSDLYIPTIGLSILLQENMRTDPGNI